MNRRGFKYIVGEDSAGKEIITIYNPEILLDQKSDDGVATVHNPNRREEVRRLENPDNF